MAVITPPSLTPAPTPAPQRNDRTTFSSRVDAFVTWLITAVTEFGAVANNVALNATDAATSASTASTQASNAGTSASLAQQAALSAGSLVWISGTTYAIGDLRYSPVDFQDYRRITAGAGAIDPSIDNTNWVATTASGKLLRSTRTSNTVLAASDNSTLIDITSGTFTQTFAAAATLEDGWFCYIKNSGAGGITLAPNASELIDGLTSYVMYPGEVRLVQCDGVELRSIALQLSNYQEFLSSGIWTKPAGAKFVYVEAIGGGAGGNLFYGGGGGGFVAKLLKATDVGATVSVSIGAGGLGRSINDSLINAGGDSSFGSVAIAKGGFGGDVYTTLATGVIGGMAGGGEWSYISSNSLFPSAGGYSSGAGGSKGNSGGSCVMGGAGGGGLGSVAGYGGMSHNGGDGGNANAVGAGVAGAAPGGGGGAGSTSGGAGGAGRVRVWAW